MEPITPLAVYGIVAGLIIATGCVEVGSRTSDKNTDDPGDAIGPYIGLGLLWPVALAITTIIAPFYGLYKLGILLRAVRSR